MVAASCGLADAATTALGNLVKKEGDIEKALQAGKQIPGIQGIVLIMGRQIGLWGKLKLARLL